VKVSKETVVLRTQEPEPNKMAQAIHSYSTQMKFSIFKEHKYFVVFHTSPHRNMQLILLAPESVNFVEVNVRMFADTSDQSIQ